MAGDVQLGWCMILLITPSARVQDCARALAEATSETAQVAATLQQAAVLLREEEYSAIVFDQSLLEVEPEESELVLQHIGTAITVYVNFAISGINRVVRELRAALERRKKEGIAARQVAEQTLRNDLKGTVTALLISCQMTMQLPGLPPVAQTKMQTVYELAQAVRGKLGLVE
jgi:hypothetical protein